MPESYMGQHQTVTVRPPSLSCDPGQMRDLLIANKFSALPGYDELNRQRVKLWEENGYGIFYKLIEQALTEPDRHFIKIASTDSRVVGYARGSVVDSRRARKPEWRYVDPPAAWEGFDAFEMRSLPPDECYNSCNGLMVDPEFQGKGLGRHLSTSRLSYMLRQPTMFYPVRSFVPATNIASQQFHESLGFDPVDILEPTDDMPAPMIVMQLNTKRPAGSSTWYRATMSHRQYRETYPFPLRFSPGEIAA